MKDLKLFIWKDVLADYTGGIAFALAENVEEARKIISFFNSFYIKRYMQLKKRHTTRYIVNFLTNSINLSKSVSFCSFT